MRSICRSKLIAMLVVAAISVPASSLAFAATIKSVELGKQTHASESDNSTLALTVILTDIDDATQLFALSDGEYISLEHGKPVTGQPLELKLPLDLVRKLLSGHGRSLWLAAGSESSDSQALEKLNIKYRFDVPAIDVVDVPHPTSSETSAQVELQTTAMLPGWRALVRDRGLDGQWSAPRLLTETESVPRIVPVKSKTDANKLTVQWNASLNRDSDDVQDRSPSIQSSLLYLENIDGSRSTVFQLDRTGKELVDIRKFQEPIAAPVDELCVVPDVTGMTIDRAGAVMAQAGLYPVPVPSESLRELPSSLFTIEWLRSHVVEQQGLDPDSEARRGSVVFLTIKGPEAEILLDARESWGGVEPGGGLIGEVGKGTGRDKRGGLEDISTVDRLDDASQNGEQSPTEREPLDPEGGLLGSVEKGTASKKSGGLTDESTVNLLPPGFTDRFEGASDEKSDPADVHGGLLGTVDKGTAKKPRGGLIDESQVTLLPQPGIDILPVEALVTDDPHNQTETPQQELESEIPSKIELVKMTDVPDLKYMTLPEAKNALALVSLEETHEGIILDTDVVIVQDPLPGLQKGTGAVRLQFEATVPKITNRLFSKALPLLARHGLKSDVGLVGHEQHGCIGQQPAPHSKTKPSTLPHGEVVRVVLGALVPDVRGKTWEQGREVLRKTGLVGTTVANARLTDVILTQDPRPHSSTTPSILKLGSQLRLNVGRLVPLVERISLEEAEQRLTQSGFVAKSARILDRSALIENQQPRAETLAAIGSEVTLSLKVTVPDVTNLTLAEAHTRLENAGFLGNATNSFAGNEDKVIGQKPVGGTTNVALGSTVTLSPVVAAVPNVVGKTISEAVRKLHDRERFVVDFPKELVQKDLVTAQIPKAGKEFERGKTVKVVSLVKVPKVFGQLPEQGIKAISGSRLTPDLKIKWIEGDYIVRQNPLPGRSTLPRSKVELWFGREAPDVVDMSYDQADKTLKRLGFYANITQTIQEETMDKSLEDKAIVWSQFPKPGKPITRTDPNAISLNVVMKNYNYVPPVEVGEYRDLDKNTVSQMLQQAGLFGRITDTRTELTQNPRQGGQTIVEWQNPLPGTLVPPESTVILRCVYFQYIAPNNDQNIHGGGGCVAVTMWLDKDRQASDIKIGDYIDGSTYAPIGKMRRQVRNNEVVPQPCLRMVTESGISIVASTSTPMTMQDGSCKMFPEMLGEMVLVDDRGDIRWEKVVKLNDVGVRDVVLFNVNNQSYFAGESGSRRIATHNQNRDKSGGQGGGRGGGGGGMF